MGSCARLHGVLGTILILCCGCGFSVPSSNSPTPDAPADMLVIPPKAYWTMAAVTKNGASSVAIYPFDGTAFKAPCPEHPTTLAVRDLLAHPSLPFVFEVESGIHALSLTCSSITESGMSDVAGVRPIQQIGFDSANNVGFFSADGALAIGVYRFVTSAVSAAPMVTGSANAPSNAGTLVLDAPAHLLFTAGNGITAGYVLDAAMNLPITYTSAAGCGLPTKLLLSGNYVLQLCADVPDIKRYTKSPFVFDRNVGAIGAVDQAVPLSGDRVVVARVSPTDLAVVALAAGTPTWTAGPALASRATALAVSSDGEIVASGRVVDATTSEIALWRLSGSSLTLLSRQTVTGYVTALAVTTPGT